MKILVDLPEESVANLQLLAQRNRMSRKSFMEKILIDYAQMYADGPPPQKMPVNGQIQPIPDGFVPNSDIEPHLDKQSKIAAFQREIEGLGGSSLAKARKKYLENQIKQMQQNH